MSRASREQATAHRAQITEASSRLFRERGIDGVSVSDLMAAAGLTHGGFYGHFESKEALVAEACEGAFRRSTERWSRRVLDAPNADAARTAIVEGFLTAQSRNDPGVSCPTASLATDVARAAPGAPVRGAFAAGVERLVDILTMLQKPGPPAARRRAALADLSMLVGTVVMARATANGSLSDELLAAGRHRLLKPKAKSKSRALRAKA